MVGIVDAMGAMRVGPVCCRISSLRAILALLLTEPVALGRYHKPTNEL